MVLASSLCTTISWSILIDSLWFYAVSGLIHACVSASYVVLLDYPQYSAPFGVVVFISNLTPFLAFLITRAFESPWSFHHSVTLVDRLKRVSLPEVVCVTSFHINICIFIPLLSCYTTGMLPIILACIIAPSAVWISLHLDDVLVLVDPI